MALPQRNSRESPAPSLDPTTARGEFSRQFAPAFPRLWLMAAGLTGDRTHAEDIVQEAAVIAWQKFAEFESGSNFGAWMAAIVRRCASNHVRKTRNRETFATDPHTLDSCDGPTPARNMAIANPLDGLFDDHQTLFDDQLLQALRGLQPDARCCFLLRALHDFSYTEIAIWMGIPEGTAMSHVHRSKQNLKRYLTHPSPHIAVPDLNPPS